MKGLKSSLKKISTSFKNEETNSTASVEKVPPVIIDLETKRQQYQQSFLNVVQFKGYEFPDDSVHARVLENIEDLVVREEDIFLISYPATGAHFLEEIVQPLVEQDYANRTRLSEEHEKKEEDLALSVARLEASNPFIGHIRWLKSLKSPRLISTHLPYDLLPRQLQTPNCKIIYLVRNPKDHLIAYYYHHRLKGVKVSLDDFIELYLNGFLLYGNYFDHVIAFWQLSRMYPNNVLFISFEELKIITKSMTKLIANFLLLNLNDEEIDEVIAKKSATATTTTAATVNNNNNTSVNCEELKNEAPRDTSLTISKFHGVLGDWVNYFDSAQSKKMDEMIRIKFESQKLKITSETLVATRRVQKYGRIIPLSGGDQEKMWTTTENDDYSGLTMKSRAMIPFRKKPIFTKAEAMFIRRKDKVVIVEENKNKLKGEGNSPGWFVRLFQAVITCCFCCGRVKPGYTTF